MNRKERNKMELVSGSDVYRLIRKSMKDKGYDTSVEEVKEVINSYVDIVYTCLLNGIRVTVPNLGEFFRDIKKGRKKVIITFQIAVMNILNLIKICNGTKNICQKLPTLVR